MAFYIIVIIRIYSKIFPLKYYLILILKNLLKYQIMIELTLKLIQKTYSNRIK